jgi:hypothetical protein
MKLFSYVVQHDFGFSPNPYFNFCTLCLCKYRENESGHLNVVELAARAKEKGEAVWVVGTGGADLNKSGGNGKLVYAMRVDEVLSRGEYYEDSRFSKKRRLATGTYEERRGDNIKPNGRFEARKQFALISRYFFYFGRTAIEIPARFRGFEKRGPSFRCRFEDADIIQFVKWIEGHKRGVLGEPCGKEWLTRKETKACKSCC